MHYLKYLLPVLLGMLSACTVLPEAKQVVVNKYVIEYSARQPPVSESIELPVLMVTLPRAHAGFDTARIAYRQQPFGLDYFARSRWADTPARMLAPLIAEAISATGHMRAMHASPGTLSASYRLDSELIDFYHDFTSSPSAMHVTLRARLFSARDNRVLASRLIEIREHADSDDAYGGVQAANRATASLLGQLAEFTTANFNR